MEALKDYEKELNKCSKCGLCENICPLYKISPNDCVASKGKFIMLHGVTKGELKLSKNINKYIDMCLKCGKCQNFCPSDIDICKILATAKFEYNQNKTLPKFIYFLQNYPFKMFLGIGKFISRPFRPKKNKSDADLPKVLYFKGCINQMCPRTDNYIKKIFKDKTNIIEPDFECCGLPFLSEGNVRQFESCASYNINILNNYSCDIVTDCASCANILTQYKKYFGQNCKYTKVIDWGEIIAKQNLKFVYKKHLKVAFHKPCHLKDDTFIKKIMENCSNIEFIEYDGYDDCCGMAGNFAVKNPKLFYKLSKQKIAKIKNLKVDYIITTCPSCIIGLKLGMKIHRCNTKVVSLLEFLAKAR